MQVKFAGEYVFDRIFGKVYVAMGIPSTEQAGKNTVTIGEEMIEAPFSEGGGRKELKINLGLGIGSAFV